MLPEDSNVLLQNESVSLRVESLKLAVSVLNLQSRIHSEPIPSVPKSGSFMCQSTVQLPVAFFVPELPSVPNSRKLLIV